MTFPKKFDFGTETDSMKYPRAFILVHRYAWSGRSKRNCAAVHAGKIPGECPKSHSEK